MTRNSKLLSAIAVFAIAACGSSDPGPDLGADVNWRSFGHDYHNTRSNTLETTVGTDNVGDLELIWEILDQEITSTPAVVDDIVYFADWSGRLYARNAADGSEVWTRENGRGITSSMAIIANEIYVGDNDAVLHRVDRTTGDDVWSVQLDDHPAAGLTGSPLPVADRVLVGVSSGELGQIKDDYTFRGSVVALSRDTGQELWRVYMTEDDETSGAGVSVWSSPAIDEEREMMYIGTGNTYEPPASPRSDSLIAINYMTGEVAWVRQFTDDDVYTIYQELPQGPDADIGAAPNLFRIKGRDVVGVGDKGGNYGVLDRDTGEVVWLRQVGPGSHLGGIMTAAAYHDGTIFLATNRWPLGFNTENVFVPNFGDPINTSEMVALDARTGEDKWRVPIASPSIGGILYANGVVYAGHTLGLIRAYDAETGDVLWEDQAGVTLASGQSISNGRLFAGHGFGFIGITGGDPGEEGGMRAYGLPASD